MTKATPSLYLLAFVLLTRLAYADQEIERGQIQTNNFIVDVSDRKLGQEVAELAEKCNEGTLTAVEREEYEAYVSAINEVSILQAKARRVLKQDAA